MRNVFALLMGLAVWGCQPPEVEDPYSGYQRVGAATVNVVADGKAGDGEVGFTAHLVNVGNARVYAIECVLAGSPNDAEFLELEVVETSATYLVDDDGNGKPGSGEKDSVHDGPDKTSIRAIHRAGVPIERNGTCRVNGKLRLPKNQEFHKVQIRFDYGPAWWR
jgi:hypothetical protein